MLIDTAKFAQDWKWLIDLDRYSLLAVSPFGDLFLKDETDALCLLDVNLGCIEYAELQGSDPAILFPISFDDRIAAGYREAGLVLSEGKCYGLKKQGVAGGSFTPKNIYVATAIEYISFMGDFHYQIKDVADGESVYLKVIQ
jgi:hypothetical protein